MTKGHLVRAAKALASADPSTAPQVDPEAWAASVETEESEGHKDGLAAMGKTYGAISDFAPEEFVYLKDVLGLKLLFQSYRPIKTKFGVRLLAECVDEVGEIVTVLIGGQVVMDQLTRLKAKLPLWGTVVRENRYYKLV